MCVLLFLQCVILSLFRGWSTPPSPLTSSSAHPIATRYVLLLLPLSYRGRLLPDNRPPSIRPKTSTLRCFCDNPSPQPHQLHCCFWASQPASQLSCVDIPVARSCISFAAAHTHYSCGRFLFIRFTAINASFSWIKFQTNAQNLWLAATVDTDQRAENEMQHSWGVIENHDLTRMDAFFSFW